MSNLVLKYKKLQALISKKQAESNKLTLEIDTLLSSDITDDLWLEKLDSKLTALAILDITLQKLTYLLLWEEPKPSEPKEEDIHSNNE